MKPKKSSFIFFIKVHKRLRFSFIFFPFFFYVAPWCSGYRYCTTSFNKAWTQVLRRFKPCLPRIGDFWQWSRLEIRLNAFRWSTIPQKQFIIIIIIIIIKVKVYVSQWMPGMVFFFIWLQCLVSLYHRSMLFLLNKSHCIVGLLVIQVLLLNFVGPWVKMPK